MAMGKAELRRLVRAQAEARKKLEQTAVDEARTLTRAMSDDDWRNADTIRVYSKKMAAKIQATQRLAASTADAYQARVLRGMTGRSISPAGQIDVRNLRGIPSESVYGRIANNYRYLISEGLDEIRALQRAVDRAEVAVQTDVMLAVRAQNHTALTRQAKTLVGYRRVLHPERSDTGVSCGLCIVASTRLYRVEELMPIHDRCHCAVAPVHREDDDPADAINLDDIAEIYQLAGGNVAEKLKKTRFAIEQHGELGPVLTYQGNYFRGPKQVEKDTQVPRGE